MARFIVFVKATEDSEKGVMPSEEMLAAMGAYNEELVKAGIMLDGAGLRPSSDGARIRFSGSDRTVTDGPFAETKEAVGGFDIIEAASFEEAVDIAAGHPVAQIGTIEVRPFWGT